MIVTVGLPDTGPLNAAKQGAPDAMPNVQPRPNVVMAVPLVNVRYTFNVVLSPMVKLFTINQEVERRFL
jgi:hypothetical protein